MVEQSQRHLTCAEPPNRCLSTLNNQDYQPIRPSSFTPRTSRVPFGGLATRQSMKFQGFSFKRRWFVPGSLLYVSTAAF